MVKKIFSSKNYSCWYLFPLCFLLFLFVYTLPLRALDNDISGCITAQWGTDSVPIKIFGKIVTVGQVATATLRESEEKAALAGFEDPLPVHSQCPGYGYYRDADISIISRITIGDGRVLVVIRHAGGRSANPGSQGYVLLKNGWKIVDVLTTGIAEEYGSCYINVRNSGTRINWVSRAGCSGCACMEGRTYIAFIAAKTS